MNSAMDKQLTHSHKISNLLQSVLLIASLSLLLAFSSWLLFGPGTWFWVLAGVAVMLLAVPKISPFWLLQIYRARPIARYQAPQLVGMVEELAARAELPATPRLFWVPSHTLNAFAVGSRRESAIAITEGLLQLLNSRELAGVLAHEISHIRNNDLRIMMLADVMTRLTWLLAQTGVLAMFILLPFIVFGEIEVSIFGLLLLIVTPAISALLQLGLSRVREFDADLDAARITHDPAGLASALGKLEQRQVSPWQRIMLPGYRERQPSIMRTHPHTHERVNRLLSLQAQTRPVQPPMRSADFDDWVHPWGHVPVRRPRHRFFTGTWH